MTPFPDGGDTFIGAFQESAIRSIREVTELSAFSISSISRQALECDDEIAVPTPARPARLSHFPSWTPL
jgi:hypothetical protein